MADERLTPETMMLAVTCLTAERALALLTSEVNALWAERDEARAEVARLQRQVEGHCDRIARQAELLSRRAEKGSEAVRDIVLGLLQYVEHEDGCEYYQMGKPHPCTCGLGKYTELWASLAKEGGG
jgi:hypothetical protein